MPQSWTCLDPTYATKSYSMLVESRPLYDIWFECVVDQGNELECKSLERLVDRVGTWIYS